MRRIDAAIMSMSRIARLTCVEVTRATHPRFWADISYPVCEGRNAAQILPDMLFAYKADRNDASAGVGEGHTEKLLRKEDALCVMAQCAVSEIGDDFLAAVEPRVDGEVVLGSATPFASRCEFQRKATRYSDLMAATVPI